MSFEIVLDFASIRLFEGVLQRAPVYFEEEILTAGEEISNELLETMQAEGAEPDYPIPWDSDQQRKAFFATQGFGQGVPTVRTGALAAGWHSQVGLVDTNKIVAVVKNDIPTARFVQDRDFQSQIHVGRWNTIQAALEGHTSWMIDRLHEAALRALERIASLK